MNFRVSATVQGMSAAGNPFPFVICMSEFDHDCTEEDAVEYIRNKVSTANPEITTYSLVFEMVPTLLH